MYNVIILQPLTLIRFYQAISNVTSLKKPPTFQEPSLFPSSEQSEKTLLNVIHVNFISKWIQKVTY